MKWFGGLSGGVGRVRAGLSWRGTPWIGARAGSGAMYGGMLARVDHPKRLTTKPGKQDVNALVFEVKEDGTVWLGDAELNLEQLRTVVAEADRQRAKA